MNTYINEDDSKFDQGNHKTWQRLVFMVIFAVLLHVASAVMWVLCIMQFLFTVFTQQDNTQLRKLGSSISTYINQVLNYVSYNTDTKPFPFSDWPDSQK